MAKNKKGAHGAKGARMRANAANFRAQAGLDSPHNHLSSALNEILGLGPGE